MARRFGGLSRVRGALQASLRRLRGKDDPYWDDFINRPPHDVRNMITEIVAQAPEGNVFPTQAELHSPNVTAKHAKELTRYLGGQCVGIADLGTQTPAIAREMCETLWEAGAPRDVLQFIAGKGETVGAALVRDPRVAIIAFTGSKVKQGDADMVLAREVVKGTDTLVLRDDKGNPVWNWKH